MTWKPMTLDEYAEYQRANGARTIKIGETWWTEARPFFYRPMFPFAEIDPETGNYPLGSLIGGVLHLVPQGAPSNAFLNLLVYDQLQDYSIAKVGAKQRWIIRQGLKNFEARRITDVETFLEEAFHIYATFYSRTKYFYMKERIRKEAFATWAEALFRYPKVVVMGAYRLGKLSAVDISYRVEEVIIDDVFFSDTVSQSLRVTDMLLHTLREGARASDARYLFRGFPSGKESLDDSKIKRGCKVVRLPAYLRINPVALAVGKVLMIEGYQKLVAMTSPALLPGAPLSPKLEDAGKLGFLAPQNFK